MIAHGAWFTEWLHVLPWLGSGALALTIAVRPWRRKR